MACVKESAEPGTHNAAAEIVDASMRADKTSRRDRARGQHRCYRAALIFLSGLLWLTASPVWSQLIPLPPKPPQLPTVPPPAQPPGLELPSPRPPSAPGTAAAGPKIVVKEIQVVGSTAFTPQQLAEVTASYTNRELTAEDLEALRLGLTYFYINHGYVTSGAVVPEQDVADGVLTMQIIEGKITAVNVEDIKWFRPVYFQSRINLAAGPPLHVGELEDRLRIIQSNPRIERINAELLPGLAIGENTLNVKVRKRIR